MDLVRAAEFGEIPADVGGLNGVAVEGYGGGEGRYEPKSCLCAHGDRRREVVERLGRSSYSSMDVSRWCWDLGWKHALLMTTAGIVGSELSVLETEEVI